MATSVVFAFGIIVCLFVFAVSAFLEHRSKSHSKESKMENSLNANVQLRERSGLKGRVLDSRPMGRGFEPHRRHCVVVLEQDTFTLA